MKVFDINDIRKIIVNNNIRFVGFCITPWHLLGAKVCYESIKETDKDVTPIFLILKHPETGFCVEESITDNIIYCKKKEIQLSDALYNIFSNILDFLCFNKHKIYVASPWMPNTRMRYNVFGFPPKKVIYYIFEEGIESYDNNAYSIISYYKKNGFSKHFLMFANNIILSKLLSWNRRVEYFMPFSFKDNMFVKNHNVINYYKKILSIDDTFENKSNSVLILTQENDAQHISYYKKIVNIIKQNIEKVYIKPHPRFPIDKDIFANVCLLPSGAIEDVYKKINCKFVIGIDSTALLTLNYLYGATTISIINMNIPGFNLRSELYINKLFDNCVLLPNNKFELESILKNEW